MQKNETTKIATTNIEIIRKIINEKDLNNIIRIAYLAESTKPIWTQKNISVRIVKESKKWAKLKLNKYDNEELSDTDKCEINKLMTIIELPVTQADINELYKKIRKTIKTLRPYITQNKNNKLDTIINTLTNDDLFEIIAIENRCHEYFKYDDDIVTNILDATKIWAIDKMTINEKEHDKLSQILREI